MIKRIVNDPLIGLLDKSLTVGTRRQELIASNIANLDTPNYTPKDINFESTLSACLNNQQGVKISQTHSRHLLAEAPPLEVNVQDSHGSVDIDQEMVKLTKNQLKYQTHILFLSRKLRGLSDIIEVNN